MQRSGRDASASVVEGGSVCVRENVRGLVVVANLRANPNGYADAPPSGTAVREDNDAVADGVVYVLETVSGWVDAASRPREGVRRVGGAEQCGRAVVTLADGRLGKVVDTQAEDAALVVRVASVRGIGELIVDGGVNPGERWNSFEC